MGRALAAVQMGLPESKLVSLELIICSHNRPQLLEKCLRSILAAESAKALAVTVTVVDNCSNPDLHPVVAGLEVAFSARDFRLQYLAEHSLGKAHALNAAVRHASGFWLAFIDDDEELLPDWFTVLEQALKTHKASFFSGITVARDPFEIPPWVCRPIVSEVLGVCLQRTLKLTRFRRNRGLAIGGNLVVQRSLLKKMGPYDTRLGRCGTKRIFSCEDHDMSERLIRSGKPGYFLPGLRAYHHTPLGRQTKSYFRRWYFDHAISEALLLDKYPDMPRKIVSPGKMLLLLIRLFYDFESELHFREQWGLRFGLYSLRLGRFLRRLRVFKNLLQSHQRTVDILFRQNVGRQKTQDCVVSAVE